MNTSSRVVGQIAGLGGLAFVVLLVASIFTLGTPANDAAAAEWAEYLSDSGNRVQTILSGYFAILAGLAYLVFLGGLRRRLQGGSRAPGLLASVSLTAGVAFAVFLMIGGVCFAAVSGAIEFGDAEVPDDGTFGLMFEQLGFGAVLAAGGLCASLSVFAASVAAYREKFWASWLAIVGIIVAVVLVFSPVFFPLIALPIWVLIVSWQLVREAGAS